MYLKHLSLTNYRNYTRLEIDLPARIVVLQGENAQGKTNFLESIYFLATTRSPLASTERQLINWAAEQEVIPYARVTGLYQRGGAEHTLEITLAREGGKAGGDEEPTLKRQVRLDNTPRRAIDTVGQMNVVLFLPEDIALVAGGPGERRHYLDVTLCQIDPSYCRALARYNRILTQRNALLKQIREGQARVAELEYWDDQLSRSGSYVLSRRLWAVEELGQRVYSVHPVLTDHSEVLALSYLCTLAEHLPQKAWAETGRGLAETADEGSSGVMRCPDGSQRAELLLQPFRSALNHARGEETARAVTLVGPHRDDLRFAINGIDATIYGSRGQQRTVALALKLAEVDLMNAQTGEMPILLLDDVISELDERRSQFLLQAITRAEQVFVTTTSLALYPRPFLDAAVLWRIMAGQVRPAGHQSLPRQE